MKKNRTRLLIKASGNGLVVMLLAATLGYFSVSKLKHNAQAIVDDTLPGLSYAGEANAYLADATRTLQVIVTEDPAQRMKLREEITGLSQRTTGYLERYAGQMDSEEDRANYQSLLQERKAYIQTRDQVLVLARSSSESIWPA